MRCFLRTFSVLSCKENYSMEIPTRTINKGENLINQSSIGGALDELGGQNFYNFI